MTRYTLHVETDDLDALGAAIALIERHGGCRVSCPAHDARERLRERDSFLVQALELMSGTSWGRCVQLEAEIRRFESVIWPRLRDRETPPEGGSMLRTLLFRARQCGLLPTTARWLYDILKRDGAGAFSAERD